MDYYVIITEKTGNTAELVMGKRHLDDLIDRVGRKSTDLLKFSAPGSVYAVHVEDIVSVHAQLD